MRGRQFGELIVRSTDGLLRSVTDLLLFQTYLVTALIGKHTKYEMDQGITEAQQLLEEINYTTIKSACYRLMRAGLIVKTKTPTALEIAITDLGKRRIDALFPAYHEKRPWDGHMYLISYDIPTKASSIRDLLRRHIHRAGAALLQESLWVTPYNPQKLLLDFSKHHHNPGTILVSKLGKDGAIGAEDLTDLLVRIYHLKDINERYHEFIQTYKNTRPQSLLPISLAYLSILKDDPQLPFALEPENFLGKQAYVCYRRLFHLS
ncbi:hypothetical protein A2Z00_04140 [Candidatus Gottesmanbacteria bacterium RBG_13_45_10]|uniref:Transcriptional repressor PaaX-like central Cas2-like domain-containing protein n=1 Tax=Candidatus Gottesmanbacteria bacterium RBG_13_45_10 TaxID=1798370 RepID=A0A1F5ZHH6_9BACT|nr:MAG: hypothetical protein A2Z00_04140 [Candidatus Gottesmanbacteria bacterium RBG_13_45_10]